MSGTYVAVLKARASAVFYPEESFGVNYIRPDQSPLTLTFRTTFDHAGFDAPLPRDLLVEARGQADNIKQAVEVFGNAALGINCLLSLVTNAHMGDLETELVFNADADADEHDFLQV